MDTLQKTIVIIPCYNEADRLNTDAFVSFIKEHNCIDFLFVNDGSIDKTNKIIIEMQKAEPTRIHLVDLLKNCGKAEAVRKGFLKAFQMEPAFIGYWDADLATPLETIKDFINTINEKSANAVFGSRVMLLGREIRRNPYRHYAGRFFATLASQILNLPVYDTQCGAKLFRNTEQLPKIFHVVFITRWIFDVEIIARFLALEKIGAVKTNYFHDSTIEYPLFSWYDIAGSKVGLEHFFIAFLDLMRICYFRIRGYKNWERLIATD